MIDQKSDLLIANHYAPQILTPIKYGESGVFFWFPGCGMTSIEQDIFNNKNVIKKQLQGLATRLRIWQLWGHLATEKTANGLINISFESEQQLINMCHEVLDSGNEVVLVVGKIDNFSDIEKIKILQILLKVLEINKRRIHIILNLLNKPWWEKILVSHPEFVALANRFEIIKTLPNNLLDIYIEENSSKFGTLLSQEKKTRINDDYGGILKLVKESLRSVGDESGIEVKIGVIWQSLPVEYQEAIKSYVVNKRKTPKTKIEKDLIEFGVWKLNGFKKNFSVLMSDPENILSKTLTPEEIKLWNKLKENINMIIPKDEVITILRPKNGDDLSLWAVDQAISRFRKKLKYAGVDSDQLITKKSKGYIWAI